MSRLVDLSRLLGSEALSRTTLADDTGVVLDVESLKVFSLNRTGMFLVEQLAQGVQDREALIDALTERYDVDRETAAADLDEFVSELLEKIGGLED